MAFHCVGTHPVIHRVFVPPALDCVVVAGRVKKILVWMPFDKLHILGVTAGYRHTIVFVVWTHFSDPNGLISTASSQILTVMGPCHTFYFVFMAFQLLNAFESKGSTTFSFPDASGSIEARTSQQQTIRMPSQISDCSLMCIRQYSLNPNQTTAS